MAILHLLGTGAALSDAHRTTTMLAFRDAGSVLVVDCGGDVIQRLRASGIGIDEISALILTHEHPDHVSGFPLFMEKIWLAGRRAAIPVHGIEPALDQARRVFDTFNTSGWEGLPEISWRPIADQEQAAVLEDDLWRVTASPGRHGVPVAGVRVENRRSAAAVAYSSDTEPADTIRRLAEGAAILVHEATGGWRGHSSAQDAARIAAQAGVGRLLLVHLPPGLSDNDLLEARRLFPGVELGEELGAYEF